MSSTSQDQALHQLQQEQSRLLDRIDELRTIGVGSLVELPQLIVCGNQSSGKSSVLEAISRVRFPARSNVCTRFATEVILRRNQIPRIKISISPGPSRVSEDERARIRSFTHEAFSNGDDLPELIEKAKHYMGLEDSTNSGFSDDVLRVEISGPDKPELTLVDLPGLYHSTSQAQGIEGIRIVRDLTKKYMRNPRSIILAVISAKTDYHLQGVLNMADKYDPHRERTLGIITQPDILEAGSDEEESYLQFLRNERVVLMLGWHALRNRSFETRDVPDQSRDELEKAFFMSGKWLQISRENVGVESLRRRLSTILMKHIQRNLPGLIADIEQKISDREQKLQRLGPYRSTLQQQRGFLLSIGSDFERITGQATNGMYADDFFNKSEDDDYAMLRAHVRQLNEYFAEAMTIRGNKRTVLATFYDQAPICSKDNPYIHCWTPETIMRHNLAAEVSETARRSQGIELPGNANQLLVGKLFRDQSQPWEALAKAHLLKAWDAARQFVFNLLSHLRDEHTCGKLASSIIEPALDTMRENLLSKLDELTAYTKSGHPLPIGKSYLTQIQKARGDRVLKYLKQNLGSDNGKPVVFTMETIEKAVTELETSRDDFAGADIIDQMQAYYDIAIVTFIDNVATLGIENCLLGPLQRIFTSQTVNDMEESEIRELAEEPSYVGEERARLTEELNKLKTGVQTFSVFRPVVSRNGVKVDRKSKPPATSSNIPNTATPSHLSSTAEKGTSVGGIRAATTKTAPSGADTLPRTTDASSPFGSVPPTTSTQSLFGQTPNGGEKSSPQPSVFGTSQKGTPSRTSYGGSGAFPKAPSIFDTANTSSSGSTGLFRDVSPLPGSTGLFSRPGFTTPSSTPSNANQHGTGSGLFGARATDSPGPSGSSLFGTSSPRGTKE